MAVLMGNIKSKLKYVYFRIDNNILDVISKRNIRHKRRITHSHPSIGSFKNIKDINALLKLARRYDIEEFFVYRVKLPKTKLSMPRRWLLRMYIGARDLSIRMVKSIYHLGWSK